MSRSATVEAPRPVPSERELVRLVARARAGDGAAFGAVLRHYDGRLRALAFRLLGDPARTDDVLQEAYVKAYRALPRFRGEADLGTWLYRIAYNACLDELRRGRGHDLPLEAADLAAAPGADPGERAAERLVTAAHGPSSASARRRTARARLSRDATVPRGTPSTRAASS